jgi:hypothetical protein
MQNRQIHLDFHTNGLIHNIGGKFDSEKFVSALKDAQVGEICLFARCHHGWCYYPTKHGQVHPHLKEPDLLGKQLKACRKAGIETSLYTTICWDELTANNYPQWLAKTADNQIMKMNPHTGRVVSKFEPGWQFLCWNSGYREFFKAHLADLLSQHSSECLFLDILFHAAGCVCNSCIERMKANNLDPENSKDAERNSIDSAREFMTEINAFIHSIDPKIKPFYNSRLRVTGIVEDGSRPELDKLGYLAIESLPSGPWGYDHFPIFAKYFQNFATDQKPIIGHTGKFQKMWGDFGGLKNQAALDYEVMRMLSHGVAASVGDQLHPEGELDKPTYELIGKTFEKALQVEKYLLPSKPIDEIGVLFTNKHKIARNFGTELDAETGAMKLLTQLQYQFSFIDEQSDFSKYKLLILPDEVVLNENLQNKINSYAANGGKILASYNSGSDEQGNWSIPHMDIKINGDYPFSPYYVYPQSQLLEKGIPNTDHIFYLGGKDVQVNADYSILAKITDPYFNRTWDHFCSHAQTPPAKRTDNPEMTYNNENMVYFSSPMFTCYNQYSPKVIKQMVDYAIRQLLESKMVESNLPSTAEVVLRENPAGQKLLAILNYIPQRRAGGMDVVEDTFTLKDVQISLALDKDYKTMDVVNKTQIKTKLKNNGLQFTISEIKGYTVIVLE